MNIFNFDALCNMFVRPTRQTYKKSDLGRNEFTVGSDKKRFYRDDVSIAAGRQRIELSLFSPFAKHEQSLLKRCVVYLHCNTGCRVEGLPYVKPLLHQGYCVVLFDFIGSGLSSGEYISLGYNETYDIHAVVSYLRRLNPSVEIALWGRSMGAVAAIRYCTQNTDIKSLVLDSPFGSLRELALHIGNEKTWLPYFIINIFLNFINPRIKEKSGVELDDINNHTIINNMDVACLFITSQNDNVVKCEQVQRLFEQYHGQKELMYIESDHHEMRDQMALRTIMQFLCKTFNSHKGRPSNDSVRPNYQIQASRGAVGVCSTNTERRGITNLTSKEGDMLKNRFIKSDR